MFDNALGEVFLSINLTLINYIIDRLATRGLITAEQQSSIILAVTLSIIDVMLFATGFFLVAEDSYAKKHNRPNLFQRLGLDKYTKANSSTFI